MGIQLPRGGSRRNQAGQQEAAVGGESKCTPRGHELQGGVLFEGEMLHPTPYEAEEETQVVGLTSSGSDPHPPKEERDPKMNGVEPS